MVEFNEDGLEKLNKAVILQAVRDYVIACKHHDGKTMCECEKFFQSDWFGAFSRLDGNALLERLRDEVKHHDC